MADGRDLEAHVDMIGHRVPLQNIDSFLLTRISKCPSHRTRQLAISDRPSILWIEHDMVLGLPTDVRQGFEVFHAVFLLAQRGFWKGAFSSCAVSAASIRAAWPNAMGLQQTNKLPLPRIVRQTNKLPLPQIVAEQCLLEWNIRCGNDPGERGQEKTYP